MRVEIRLILCIAIGAFLVAIPVGAAINTIPAGGTVFIGEDGLDITATGAVPGGQLAYWSAGSSTTDVPSSIVNVDDPTNFYISQVNFGGRTGPWYTYPARTFAFNVQDPTLEIRVMDESAGFEITPVANWIPKGDQVGFRINSNLNPMASRPGASGAPITIHVRGPDGGEFSGLIDAGGNSNSIVDIPVSTSSFETGAIWDTGNQAYTQGKYAIWADCNANSMKDNYPVTGKTITAQVNNGNVIIQRGNPLITTTPATPVITTPVITLTTTPSPTTPAQTTVPSTATTTPISTTVTTPTPPPTTVAPPTTTPGFGVVTSVLAGIALFCILRRKQ